MSSQLINFNDFELPFIIDIDRENSSQNDDDSTDEENENISSNAKKELMESKIPKSAIYLGSVEMEIDNWTSWVTNDEYYLYSLKNEEFDWALFRISWDDNWNTWNWSFDGRVKGFVDNYKDAARLIMSELFKKWQIDLSDPKNEPYVELLDRL